MPSKRTKITQKKQDAVKQAAKKASHKNQSLKHKNDKLREALDNEANLLYTVRNRDPFKIQ
jgi:regulator of replication initiation timing